MKTRAIAALAALLLTGAVEASPLGYSTGRGSLTLQEIDEVSHWRFLKKFDASLVDATGDALIAKADPILTGDLEEVTPPPGGGCALDINTIHQLEHWLWFRAAQPGIYQQAIAKHAQVKDLIARAESCWCGGATTGALPASGTVVETTTSTKRRSGGRRPRVERERVATCPWRWGPACL